jgi:hypothetical protein
MVAGYANEAEGIWNSTGSDTTVYGSIHQKASDEINETTVGQLSEERNIVCRLPLSASVTYGDQIVITNVHQVLNGTYEIDELMYTKTHIRAVCRRTLR